MTTDVAGQGPVERRVRPRAWTLAQTLEDAQTTHGAPLWFSDPQNTAWAPLYTADQLQPLTQSDAGVLLRAADMLTAYAELIRRDGATHVEEHHYLPDVEYIATELRTLGIHGA